MCLKWRFAAMLLLVSLPLVGQEFVEPDWDEWSLDTVLPCYTESRLLPGDYGAYDYYATIEYPEFEELTSQEVRRFRLSSLGEPLPEWPEVFTHVGVSAKKAQLDIDLIPIVQRGQEFFRLKSFKLAVTRKAKAKMRKRTEEERSGAADRYAAHSVLSAGLWVKIKVTESGVYKITRKELSAMGFSDIDKVRLYGAGGLVLPESGIEDLPDDLQEVPLWRESDYLLFYANGTVRWTNNSGLYTHKQNPYSTYGCYFLTADAAVEPMAFPVENTLTADAATEVCTTYPDHALYEVENYSWAAYGRNLYDSYDFASGRTRDYTFSLEGAINQKATLTVSFATNAAQTSTLAVQIDGSRVGSMTFSSIGSYSSAVGYAQSFTLSALTESPTVRLVQSAPSSASGRLDYLRLNYTRSLALRESCTAFRKSTASASVRFDISNATTRTRVWRVTTPGVMAQVPGTLSGNLYSAVTSNTADDEFVAVNIDGTFRSIEVAGRVEPQDLHALGQTDLVILVPASGNYMKQAETLAEAHRTKDSMTVAVVRADQVYNEFSSGTPDATAYRRLMKMLYDRAETAKEAPKYLLLYGDGVWDNRMLTSAWSRSDPDNFLLCFESENSMSEVSSYVMEDYFGLLDDGEGATLLQDKVDIGVGRFPVQSGEQADDVLQKTLNYMNNTEAGAWRNTLCILGDDGDNNQHMKDAESVASMVENTYPSFLLKRIYWDTYQMEVSATGNRYPAVKKKLKELLEEGALMVNYTGHGAPDVLSHELVFETSDMEALRSPRLPLWITASCTVGPFDSSVNSVGESGILNSKGGGIAMFTTTRTVYSTQNRRMNQFFTKYVLGKDDTGKRYTIGDAVRLAKCALITSTSASGMRDWSENKLQFVLLGDPALRLSVPEYRVAVDEFNGKEAVGESTVGAGSRVTVKGHVEDETGRTVTEFNGKLYSVVMDNKETITTKNNQDAATDPFVYVDRTKTLFAGSDSVKEGLFSFTFPVSLDINYSYENGLVNLYAVNDTKELSAHGNYSDFLLGGTSPDLSADSLGPEISLYLNHPDFTEGDEVNSTPYLVAHLYDEDGINTVGNGIGHDIVAIIDNSAAYTYTLNNYYTAELGDFTRGSVAFALPELEEGEHTLLLRAWDIMNNSSAVTLSFRVVAGLTPDLTEISVSPNPARAGTTFAVMYDRPQSNVTVTLEVYNFLGQRVWSHQEETQSAQGSYSYMWNLCSSGGQPLMPGVYLYRASLSENGGSSCTKTRKLIILGNK